MGLAQPPALLSKPFLLNTIRMNHSWRFVSFNFQSRFDSAPQAWDNQAFSGWRVWVLAHNTWKANGLSAERACDLAVPMRCWSAELITGEIVALARQQCELLAELTDVDEHP